ncbi:MAG: ATP-binding cassette domain-containing protein [Spirochaetales bacterium]|nr:ATP-binding cassette domain-containing protein [Spirochaetales bacterium]
MESHRKTPIVSLLNVKLYREGHKVLDNISIELYPGEIHAIVGDHDSGKTYIGEILSGVYQPSDGYIYLDNVKRDYLSIAKSQEWGIHTIHQDTHLIDNFTIAENLFTPSFPKAKFPKNKNKMLAEAIGIFKRFNIDIDPGRLFKDLYLSEKIVVNIIRALIRNPRLLILDESLDKLSLTDLQKISNILYENIKQNLSVLCLSHKIDDIYNFADFVSILRSGKIFITDSVDNIDRLNLIKLCYYQINSDEDLSNTSKEFYQLLKYNEAILQKLPTNLIVTDDHNNIKLINETGKKFFLIEDKNFRGEKLDVLITNENRTLLNYLYDALYEKKESSHYNLPLYIAGIVKVINFKTFPIYDGSFLIGNIIIIEDISEQEKLREQINLSEKLASVGLLAAGVAHEINNPLEIIYNHLNYLNIGAKEKEHKEIILEIEEELRDIKAIVSNLISFSDNNNASSEIYNLNDLIFSLINLIRFNAKHKQITILFNPIDSDIMIQTSKNEMKQVLLNLMKNSFEAMPNGGNIQIQTKVENRAGSSCAVILIDDNGCGIDEKNSRDIFLPFFSTKKKNEHNMGLGLSVIYGIIKKYKGEISASNRPSGGTRFKIILPCIC